jgi:hypothetical protein
MDAPGVCARSRQMPGCIRRDICFQSTDCRLAREGRRVFARDFERTAVLVPRDPGFSVGERTAASQAPIGALKRQE